MLCVFTGDWSHRDSLSSMSQDSKPPEEKQVFGMNHIVCTGDLGTVSHSLSVSEPLSSIRVVGTPKKSKFEDSSQGPILKAGLYKDKQS